MKNKPLRETLPTVAAWIDDLRQAFGAEAINASLKNGMSGGSDFWASEGGVELGNRADASNAIGADRIDPRKIDLKTCDCPACKQTRRTAAKGSPRGGRGWV